MSLAVSLTTSNEQAQHVFRLKYHLKFRLKYRKIVSKNRTAAVGTDSWVLWPRRR